MAKKRRPRTGATKMKASPTRAKRRGPSSKRGAPHAPEEKPESPRQHEAAEVESAEEGRGVDFLLVGVGASAGGLDALNELFRYVEPGGLAFIVVQHLAPDHESILPQLLARTAQMPVTAASDGVAIEADHIYVIPPNADLAVMHGVIHILPSPVTSVPRLPVDYLFRSLAEDQGRAAVGIVLSGTGTDGTLGLEAIKAAGGYTFAQDPATAKYDGMPRSALSSGAADFALAPKDIAAELILMAHRRAFRPINRGTAPLRLEEQLASLFMLVRSEFGVDLSQYKQTTIDRRIERRMVLHKIAALEHYVRFVQQNHGELRALYKDMLITVTRFFRDPDTFDALKKVVFPNVIGQREAGEPLRVWVPACATGEEAYSIAMALVEYCEENAIDHGIQIFGTDLDEDAIQIARRGAYPANIALDVSIERLNRFFTKKEDVQTISRRIRDMVVFSHHNILKDAPFSRMDLVSCRNLLIYLQPPAQKQVLRLLHYSLNPARYLLLGTSESVGDAPELFSALDRKNRIFVKQPVAGAVDLRLGVPATPQPSAQTHQARPLSTLQSVADRKVLDMYGPPGVVANENLEIIQFRGRSGPFLDPAPGTPSFNLLKIARHELRMHVKKAVQGAFTSQARVTSDVTYHEDKKQRLVRLDVIPFEDPESKARCVLVLFHELPAPKEIVLAAERSKGGTSAAKLSHRVRTLERELATTKEYLQTTIDEKENAFEQLQSTNEELQSLNEELQSTNEELETSKEEMQSTNEELTTVNEELQNRMVELSQSNDDLHNVLTGVDNAIVIVGMDLRIRRYTLAAERLFHLAPADIGRNVHVLDQFLGMAGVVEPKVSTVIQSLSVFDQEVLAANKRWYTLKITPYKTLDHSIRGAVLTFVDIDVRRRAEELTRDVGAYAEKFLAAINHPLVILDRKLRVAWANSSFYSYFQLTADETLGIPLSAVGAKQFADPGLRAQLEAVFGTSTIFRDFELSIPQPDGSRYSMSLGGSLVPASGETPLALLSLEIAVARKEGVVGGRTRQSR